MIKLNSELTLLIFLIVLAWASGFVDNNPDLPVKSGNLCWPSAKEVQRRMPYYLVGHTKDGSPIWYMEPGKWDLHEIVETDKGFEAVVQHAKELTERVSKTEMASLLAKPSNRFACISNWDGFSLKQLIHMPTIQFYMNATKTFVDILDREKAVFKVYIINASQFFLTMHNMLSHLLAPISEYVEVYGTDTEEWKAALLSQIHLDQLPQTAGGLKKKQAFLQKYD